MKAIEKTLSDFSVSTDEVYGTLKPEDLHLRNHTLRSQQPYSASKASSDFLVRSYFHTYSLQWSPRIVPTIMALSIPRKTNPLSFLNAGKPLLSMGTVNKYGTGFTLGITVGIAATLKAKWEKPIASVGEADGGIQIVQRICAILMNCCRLKTRFRW